MSTICPTSAQKRSTGLQSGGLAVDIDETLVWTTGYWVDQMISLFGNPEGLDTKTIVEKYIFADKVPYWRTPEAIAWRRAQVVSPEAQLSSPVIIDARHTLLRIASSIPVKMYATIRPACVSEATRLYLKGCGFPDAELMCRPENVDIREGNKWKARRIHELYPHITGLIDNSASVARHLPKDYRGTLFLYDNKESPRDDIRVIPCPTWKDVERAVALHREQLIPVQ